MCVNPSLDHDFMTYILSLFIWWEGVRFGLIHWELRKGDWQGHSNNERAVWKVREGGGTIWHLGFGLTSQSDSSLVLHSQVYLLMVFWGEGDGAKGYTPQNHTRHPQRKTGRDGQRKPEDEERLIKADRKKEDEWEERQIRDDTERLSSKKDGGRKRRQTGRDRSRQIK